MQLLARYSVSAESVGWLGSAPALQHCSTHCLQHCSTPLTSRAAAACTRLPAAVALGSPKMHSNWDIKKSRPDRAKNGGRVNSRSEYFQSCKTSLRCCWWRWWRWWQACSVEFSNYGINAQFHLAGIILHVFMSAIGGFNSQRSFKPTIDEELCK